MTRINTIPARMLTDQHLVAEKKEINQLAGQFLKSFRSLKFDRTKLPKTFTLGTGHVRFWYTKGVYIRKRYNEVFNECIRRGFNAKDEFNDVWKQHGPAYNMDYKPTYESIQLIKDRITDKINLKPEFYRYEGKYIDAKSYLQALDRNDLSILKFRET